MSGAVATLDEALGLWRGPAFAEFAYDDFARPEATRLEELRVTAVEDRADAKLALGRHEELIGELERTVERTRCGSVRAPSSCSRSIAPGVRSRRCAGTRITAATSSRSSASNRRRRCARSKRPSSSKPRSSTTNGLHSRMGTGVRVWGPHRLHRHRCPPHSARPRFARRSRTGSRALTATRIDLDLLEDELADNVMELHRRPEIARARRRRAHRPSALPVQGIGELRVHRRHLLRARASGRRPLARRRRAFRGGGGGIRQREVVAARRGLRPRCGRARSPAARNGSRCSSPPVKIRWNGSPAGSGVAPGLSLDDLLARLRDEPDALEHIAADALTPRRAAPGWWSWSISSRSCSRCVGTRTAAPLCRRAGPIGGGSRGSSVVDRRSTRRLLRALLDADRPGPAARVDAARGIDDPRELRRAIEEPARQAGLRLDPGLTYASSPTSGRSPADSRCLHRVARAWVRRHDSTLTLAGYETREA